MRTNAIAHSTGTSTCINDPPIAASLNGWVANPQVQKAGSASGARAINTASS